MVPAFQERKGLNKVTIPYIVAKMSWYCFLIIWFVSCLLQESDRGLAKQKKVKVVFVIGWDFRNSFTCCCNYVYCILYFFRWTKTASCGLVLSLKMHLLLSFTWCSYMISYLITVEGGKNCKRHTFLWLPCPTYPITSIKGRKRTTFCCLFPFPFCSYSFI